MCSNKFAYIIYLHVISHANASKIKHDDTVFLIFKLSNLHYIKTDAFWVLRIAAFKIFDASQSWLLCNDLMDIIKTSYFKIYVETMYDQLNISQICSFNELIRIIIMLFVIPLEIILCNQSINLR